MTHRQQNMKK